MEDVAFFEAIDTSKCQRRFAALRGCHRKIDARHGAAGATNQSGNRHAESEWAEDHEGRNDLTGHWFLF